MIRPIRVIRGGIFWLTISVRHLGKGEEAPVQSNILCVGFTQRQRRDRFRHFVAEVEGVGQIELGVTLLHLGEQFKRVGALQVHVAVNHVNFAPFGKESIVAVGDLAR